MTTPIVPSFQHQGFGKNAIVRSNIDILRTLAAGSFHSCSGGACSKFFEPKLALLGYWGGEWTLTINV